MISKAVFCASTTLESWRSFLSDLLVEGTQGILLLVGEHTQFDYERLRPLFQEYDVPIFGGVFPGLIYEDVLYAEGVVGCSISQPILLEVIPALDDFRGFSCETVASNDSVFILVDGRASNISKFLNNIFETSGSRRGFIGGGAGSLRVQHDHVLFYQETWIDQGAIVVRAKGSIGVGISHGWQPLVGPLVVNSAQGNAVKEINWQRAFPFYQQILLENEQVLVEQGDFFAVAKSYPFGMVKMDGSIIVRDAMEVQADGSMLLIGEIPQNSIIVLLQGEKEKLITTAGDAVQQAFQRYRQFTGERAEHALLVDCISRALFLGEDFSEELREIRKHIPDSVPLFGFLSFGEIASNGDRYLEFYNKTTVVGVLP